MQEISLAKRTADRLRDLILTENVYQFGDKLPNENVQIGRASCRERV